MRNGPPRYSPSLRLPRRTILGFPPRFGRRRARRLTQGTICSRRIAAIARPCPLRRRRTRRGTRPEGKTAIFPAARAYGGGRSAPTVRSAPAPGRRLEPVPPSRLPEDADGGGGELGKTVPGAPEERGRSDAPEPRGPQSRGERTRTPSFSREKDRPGERGHAERVVRRERDWLGNQSAAHVIGYGACSKEVRRSAHGQVEGGRHGPHPRRPRTTAKTSAVGA